MAGRRRFVEQFADAVSQALPGDMAGDMRRNLQTAVRGALERMELVSREELEVQEALLARTRERLEAMEQRVSELERMLREHDAGG